MSFDRSPALESQPTNVRRQDDPEYSDDPEFKQFSTSLSDRLFSLSHNINQLSNQVQYLGTRRETERVRERVQNLIEETNSTFKEIGNGLKRVNEWPDLGPSQKIIQGRLTAEFNERLASFQLVQNRAIEKQKAARAAALEQQDYGSRTSGTAQSQQLQQQQQTQESRLAPQSEVDFQEALIVEREEEIRQIEYSVGELNELFRDVATMVQDQGIQIDDISANIQTTAQETRGAEGELRQAQRYQRSARSKACCLLLVLAIVLVVVILAVVLG